MPFLSGCRRDNGSVPGTRVKCSTAWSGSNGSVERGAGRFPFSSFQVCVMVHFMKIFCGRVQFSEWCLVEERSFHVGTGEIRSSHIGIAEIGPLQIGAAEFRLTQV